MTTASSVAKKKRTQRGLKEQMRVHGWTWTSGGAWFGVCGGIISPLLGSILTAIGWVAGPEWHGLHLQRDGTILLFLTIPLLIFGAHCLDLIDRQDKRRAGLASNWIKTNGFRIEEGNGNDLERN